MKKTEEKRIKTFVKKFIVLNVGSLEIAGEKLFTFNFDTSERYWEGYKDFEQFDSIEEAEEWLLGNKSTAYRYYVVVPYYYVTEEVVK